MSDVAEFERENRDGLRTLVLRGEFDLASRDELGVQMARLIIGARSPVVVDLSRVTFLDSAGLDVLVGARKNAADAGVEIRDHPSGLSDATTG